MQSIHTMITEWWPVISAIAASAIGMYIWTLKSLWQAVTANATILAHFEQHKEQIADHDNRLNAHDSRLHKVELSCVASHGNKGHDL